MCLPGHHQQRKGSPGEKRADPDAAAGIRGSRPEPPGEQLRHGELLVGGQPRGDDGGVGGPGLFSPFLV